MRQESVDVIKNSTTCLMSHVGSVSGGNESWPGCMSVCRWAHTTTTTRLLVYGLPAHAVAKSSFPYILAYAFALYECGPVPAAGEKVCKNQVLLQPWLPGSRLHML